MKTFFAAICLAALTATPAIAGTFEVSVDHAKILRLPRPATAVVVGNPAIADAAIHDGQLLFITGKIYGTTNFIALDADGKTILSEELHVLQPNTQVTLQRGEAQSTYSCGNKKCEQVPGFGDDDQTFKRLMTQQTQKASQGDNAAGGN